MLKKHMAACLFATALMAVPALAQTSGTSPSTSPGAPSTATAASSGQFISQPQANQWRASKLVGVNIYGSDHQKIGDVNDVLLDHQGKAEAVVIGVGGFLGIGEKDVAVPFSAIQWKENRDDLQTASANRPAGASGTTATTAAGTAAGGAPTAGTGAGSTSNTTASNTAAGTSASNTTATGSTSRSTTTDRDRTYPDHGVLNMSKADLQNAPKFSYTANR